MFATPLFLCGASVLSALGFETNEADLFLVNRVACAKSSCQATCERYCSSMRLPADVTSCSSHLRLAHCTLDVEITETYKLNTSLPNVCFSADYWLFELPSWVNFRRIETVDLTFNTRHTISTTECENTNNLRVSIYDVTGTLEEKEGAIAAHNSAELLGRPRTRTSTSVTTSAVSVSYPSLTSLGVVTPKRSLMSVPTQGVCVDSSSRSLSQRGTFLEQKKVEVYKQQIVLTGSDFRGSIEQGHLTFAVKPSNPCWINGTGVDVQLSGIRRLPRSDNYAVKGLSPLGTVVLLPLMALSII